MRKLEEGKVGVREETHLALGTRPARWMGSVTPTLLETL